MNRVILAGRPEKTRRVQKNASCGWLEPIPPRRTAGADARGTGRRDACPTLVRVRCTSRDSQLRPGALRGERTDESAFSAGVGMVRRKQIHNFGHVIDTR